MTTPLITYRQIRDMALPVKETQWDSIGQARVEEVIERASQAIMDYVDFGIASAYYTERVMGSNNSTLILDQLPIQTLVTVTQTDNQENYTALTPTDFVVDSKAGMIFWKDRFRNRFYPQYDYIVYYQAGYDTIPGPLVQATALQTIEMLQPMFRGGQNFSEIKLIEGINENIVDLCERYKRKRIA